VEGLPNGKATNHISSQLVRSGTSPAPNYSESLSAESKQDFIHKLKIALKELRETEVCLKILIRSEIIRPAERLSSILKETDELISILFRSIETAAKNKER
jgi:four helix bundle protein